MALGYLVDPFIQIQNDNGTPIVGSKIYVYNADTTNLAVTYNDFEGHLNSNPILTDTLGNATIIADDGIEYDISVHDENDLLLFTKKYVSVDKTSSAGGNTQIVAGYGITVNRVGNTFTVSVDTDLIATKDDLADKQDKLTGGANIEITNDNVVNVVQRKELLVQEPLKVSRSNTGITIYVDPSYLSSYKSLQDEVIIGGGSANYISKITQNENGNVSADVGNFVAGSNINISKANDNLIVSGKDWSNDINAATSGKIDKVIDGAGSKTNPVYLSDANVVTPCFTEDNSVKFTPSDPLPDYFSGDNGGNIFLNAPNAGGSWPDDYAFRNSIVLGSQTNYRHDSASKEKYNNCIFMNSYFYGNGSAGSYEYNTLIGYNSMTNVKPDSYGNTIIGQYCDFLAAGSASCYSNTIIGRDNNIYGDGYANTMIGVSNDIGISDPYDPGYNMYTPHDITIVGYLNTYKTLDDNGYFSLLLGANNNVTQSGNDKTMAIGFDNSVSGNCTYLIGDSLTASNEGSYSDKVMKVGFGSCHLEIHSSGTIYKVINGTKTAL